MICRLVAATKEANYIFLQNISVHDIVEYLDLFVEVANHKDDTDKEHNWQ
jgi:hypothetical protein